FSKLEAGSMRVNIRNIDLDQVFKRVKETFEGICKMKNIEFRCDTSEINLISDFDHLYKVVTNLVSNAYKFTDSGYIALSATSDDQQVTINVTDSGCGIKDNEIAKIFNRFNQGTIQNNKAPGTGIGLHIVNRLVRIHGGEIKVASSFGQGSTFSVVMPIQSARARDQEKQYARKT
ncbi:MAG: HAMP domain-containing histidine kinase, partial [Spirochaetota bacterium]|nr:HAMP domain-containing histidine kinase [Spirochaetota bacterium]